MSEATTASPLIEAPKIVSLFEYWPGWLFYTPVVMHWLWLGLLYRNFTLPTAANPHIESGGLCGESKTSILDQVSGDAKTWIAAYETVVTGESDLERTLAAMTRSGLGFPIVVKPDIGCHGAGVRLVPDQAALARTLAEFPRNIALVVQEFIPFEGEAGVFYVREAGQTTGTITSLTLKHAPSLRGNGRDTLRKLILDDARLRKTSKQFFRRFARRLDDVVPAGEQVRLVFTGNHCKGSVFRDGRNEITKALTERVDAICRSLPDFHFGRVDLRYRDIASLRNGDALRIIEINGVGSEATHIWDPEATIGAAYRTQFEHYRKAFEIGSVMRSRGHRATSPVALARLWLRQTRLIASYPLSD